MLASVARGVLGAETEAGREIFGDCQGERGP